MINKEVNDSMSHLINKAHSSNNPKSVTTYQHNNLQLIQDKESVNTSKKRLTLTAVAPLPSTSVNESIHRPYQSINKVTNSSILQSKRVSPSDPKALKQPVLSQVKIFFSKLLRGEYGLLIGFFPIPIGLLYEFGEALMGTHSFMGSVVRTCQVGMAAAFGLGAVKVIGQTKAVKPSTYDLKHKQSKVQLSNDKLKAVKALESHQEAAKRIKRQAFIPNLVVSVGHMVPFATGLMKAYAGIVAPLLPIKMMQTVGFSSAAMFAVGLFRMGAHEDALLRTNNKAIKKAKQQTDLSKADKKLLNILAKDIRSKRIFSIKDIFIGAFFVVFSLMFVIKAWVANASLPKSFINAKHFIIWFDVLVSIPIHMVVPFIQNKFLTKAPTREIAALSTEKQLLLLDYEKKQEANLKAFYNGLSTGYKAGNFVLDLVVNTDGDYYTPMNDMIKNKTNVAHIMSTFLDTKAVHDPRISQDQKEAIKYFIHELKLYNTAQMNIASIDPVLIRKFFLLAEPSQLDNQSNATRDDVDLKKQFVKFIYNDAAKQSDAIVNGIKSFAAQHIVVQQKLKTN